MEYLSVILGLSIFVGIIFFLRRLIPSKGKVGEKVVSVKLERLPKDEYRVLNNVTLPTANGSSQIDHLVVSIYGIFVVETKNYNGWIYGGEHSEYWVQNIYGHKYQFYNPILQNVGHVRALRRVLSDYESLPIVPIVAFSGKASIKVKVEDAYVVYWSQIREVIHQYAERYLNWDQVESICKKIQSIQMDPTKTTAKQHIRNIQNIQEQKSDALVAGQCPRCGGTLVARDGKYGRFYGCSNYPRCRYTHAS